jgi:hypothetical protein
MRKFFLALLGLICTLSVNGAVGAVVGGALGAQPLYGALAAGGLSVVSGMFGGLAPDGVLRAGLLTEVWTGQMVKALRQDPEGMGWYSKIRSYDQYADKDAIHFVQIGGDPTVLVNNTSYPLEIENLEDGDKVVSLDKFQTKPTRVTDDELHALSYDKKASVVERHKEVLQEKKYSRALHALAPNSNSAATPVVTTTGATVDGRKGLTRQDIVRLKKQLDKNNVPKKDRVLVLCPDHIADLLEMDQKFAAQYYNYTDGKVAKQYGFEIYEYNDCPYFDATALTKVAYGAAPGANATQASVAFYTGRMMKANGTTKAYVQEAANSPTTQENLVSYRTYSICLPLKNEAMGAIVSAKA